MMNTILLSIVILAGSSERNCTNCPRSRSSAQSRPARRRVRRRSAGTPAIRRSPHPGRSCTPPLLTYPCSGDRTGCRWVRSRVPPPADSALRRRALDACAARVALLPLVALNDATRPDVTPDIRADTRAASP